MSLRLLAEEFFTNAGQVTGNVIESGPIRLPTSTPMVSLGADTSVTIALRRGPWLRQHALGHGDLFGHYVNRASQLIEASGIGGDCGGTAPAYPAR
jgi:hypothetical protein